MKHQHESHGARKARKARNRRLNNWMTGFAEFTKNLHRKGRLFR